MPALIDSRRRRRFAAYAAVGGLAVLGAALPCRASLPDPGPYRLAIPLDDYKLHIPDSGSGTFFAEPHPAGKLAALIERHARSRGLDPALVHALIRAESAYHPEAVSSKGAIGLMQVMPATGRRFGVTNLADPDANLRAGTAYLSHLIARFEDISLALAAYNAGEDAVVKYGFRIPPYPETQAYVESIMRSYGLRQPSSRPAAPHRSVPTRLNAKHPSPLYRLHRK